MGKWTEKFEKCHWFWYCCHGAMLTDCCYSIRIPSISIDFILTDTENKNFKKQSSLCQFSSLWVEVMLLETMNFVPEREAAELTSPIIAWLCFCLLSLPFWKSTYSVHHPHSSSYSSWHWQCSNVEIIHKNLWSNKCRGRIVQRGFVKAQHNNDSAQRRLCNCWIWKWSKRVHKVSK